MLIDMLIDTCPTCDSASILVEDIMGALEAHDWRRVERLALQIAKAANEQQMTPEATAALREGGIFW